MLWEIEILPQGHDPQADRVAQDFALLTHGPKAQHPIDLVSRGFLLEGDIGREEAARLLNDLLLDPLVETGRVGTLNAFGSEPPRAGLQSVATVLLKPGVMDPVAESVQEASSDLGISLKSVRTLRRYYASRPPTGADRDLLFRKVLANEAIEQVIEGPLELDHLSLGSTYLFRLITVPLRHKDDAGLVEISRSGQLSLSLAEMTAIQEHFRGLGRDPTDVELETLAQTWSEHCSHKTLKGQIDFDGRRINNLLKETIFGATQEIREIGTR